MASQRDLIQDLLEQWDFLKSSMIAFDSGRWHEAKRLALTIRVLVYDQGGTSLLTQLGVKDRLKWLASGGGVHPENRLPTQSLTSMRMTAVQGGAEVSYVPHDEEYLLDARFVRFTDFEDWWTSPVIKDNEARIFSRKNLVLMLANRDGGGHIGRLEVSERALASGRDFGWAFGVGDELVPVELSPVLPSVRTIAGELDLMLHNQRSVLGLVSGSD